MATDDRSIPGSGFVLAMHAHVSGAPYQEPWRINQHSEEWLIISCFGPQGEFLTIAHTRQPGPDADSAPPGLRPDATYLGLRLPNYGARDAAGDQAVSRYLIVRHLPEALPVAGTFLPSDGYALISRVGGLVSLEAAGRFAHSLGTRRGQDVRRDVPDPAPEAPTSMAWSISGLQRPWIGEFRPEQEP